MTHRGGGSIATKPGGDPNVNQPLVQTYLIAIEMDDPDDTLTHRGPRRRQSPPALEVGRLVGLAEHLLRTGHRTVVSRGERRGRRKPDVD